MEGFGWTERIHELEKALKEANSRTFQYSAKVDEKSEEISILEKDNVGLIVENQRLKRELNIQKSLIDLSIEHELRGDQLTQAIAELQESMEQRMPVKRKKIKK